MNRLDTELVEGRLRKAGFRRVDAPGDAQVILYYTCSVREHAEDKVYARLGALKRLKRERPVERSSASWAAWRRTTRT